MRRDELEHILRALQDGTGHRAFLVIGSQAILATFDEHVLPARATMSTEADVAPLTHVDRRRLDAEVARVLVSDYPTTPGEVADDIADAIDGVAGEWSDFHNTFDVYAQGVGTETAVLPEGWEERLVVLTGPATNYAIGLCLDPLDACAAKLVAGRPQDYEYVGALLHAGLIELSVLVPRSADYRRTIHARPGLCGGLAAGHR